MQALMIIRRSRAAALLMAGVLLLTGLLGGCARVTAALAVSTDDTVTGELTFATPAKSKDDRGPSVTVPPDLATDVGVSAYNQDGYTGSLLRFSHLSFAQFAELTRATFPAGDRVQFNLRRAGGRVLVTGSVDLTNVTVDKADFALKMSFPGRIVDANGETDSDTVSWRFTPGEVGAIRATVAYADPGAPSVLNWTLGLAGAVALAAILVVVVARRARNAPVSPPIR